MGANPPMSLVELHKTATAEVYAACGCPAGIFSAGNAQGAREDYRRFISLTVQPLMRMIANELSMKLEDEVSFSLDQLNAFDLAGRAGSFQKLVAGGLDPVKVMSLSGLLVEDA